MNETQIVGIMLVWEVFGMLLAIFSILAAMEERISYKLACILVIIGLLVAASAPAAFSIFG